VNFHLIARFVDHIAVCIMAPADGSTSSLSVVS